MTETIIIATVENRDPSKGDVTCRPTSEDHDWSGTGACLSLGHFGYDWDRRDPGYDGPPRLRK